MRHGQHTEEATCGCLQGSGRPGGRQADPDPGRAARAFQVHPVQISQWKKQLLEGLESLLGDGGRREHDQGLVIQAELYEQIGRLNMEVEWLKKKGARCG